MTVGLLSTHKCKSLSLKMNLLENSCQGEDKQKLLLQCWRIDRENSFWLVTIECAPHLLCSHGAFFVQWWMWPKVLVLILLAGLHFYTYIQLHFTILRNSGVIMHCGRSLLYNLNIPTDRRCQQCLGLDETQTDLQLQVAYQ